MNSRRRRQRLKRSRGGSLRRVECICGTKFFPWPSDTMAGRGMGCLHGYCRTWCGDCIPF